MIPDPAMTETVHLVELSALTDLARLGRAMRRAQQAYSDALRLRPHSGCPDELVAARAAEVKFDRACAVAMARERACLPGMEGGAS